MTVDASLEEKLRRLIELRKEEEARYGELLTHLDEICNFQLPQEHSGSFPEIKNALNRIWDISQDAYAAARKEDRQFWKEVAVSFEQYLEPLVRQQREVNSVVVHLFNEYIEAVHSSLKQIHQFQTTLILYFQKIVPVIDTKYREMVGTAETFQIGLRDYMDLMYQQLDRKIETLRVDFNERTSVENARWIKEENVASQANDSAGGIFCSGLFDRSTVTDAVQFLQNAYQKLKNEGVLLIEGKDTSPETMLSLLAATGFRRIQVLPFSGSDYAVIAYK